MKAFYVSNFLILLQLTAAYLPEEKMDAEQIVKHYGYPIKSFDAVTPDGYILKVHRIPFGKNSNENTLTEPRPVFFLQHGLLASSVDWISNLPHQSLAFILADAGFDVWMGNIRGNMYSKGHKSPIKNYWSFSWDEMAEYDLPTMIDTALNVTQQKSLYYVGHSQGTEIMFAKLSSDPNFAKKIRKFFALAPVATISHIRGILAYLAKYFGSYTDMLLKMFGPTYFLPNNYFIKMFAQLVCGFSYTNPACENFLFQVGGPNSNQFNKTRIAVYLSHTPAGTSTYNIVHWIQLYISHKMQKFDYGSSALNEKHYHQASPPVYDLRKVNTPTYLYYSDSDWLADTRDIEETILASIPREYIKLNRNLQDFNHFDFIWGLFAPKEIYSEIVEISRNHSLRFNRRFYHNHN